MFIKPLPKYNKKACQHYTVYQLCESYRLDGRIRHHIIVGLGKLEDKLETEEQIKLLGKRIEEKLKGQPSLDLNTIDEKVETLAQYYYNEIKKKRRYDVGERSDWQTVKVSSVKNKDVREIGAEWLCKQAFDQLAIADFLRAQGWDEEKISLATTHVISRTVYPASERKTVSFIKENSAVSEITGYRHEDITKDKLYKISRELYLVKDSMENYLSRKTNELFDLDDKIILYDLTNTYFEGRMQRSKIARYGRSKEKRGDARLIVLAAVINREGFLKYSNLFQGNMTDSKTLETIVNAISRKTSFTNRKPTVVMDAGIATDDNLRMLKAKHYDYLCVSRSDLKQYHADTSSKPVEIRDKRKQPIELMKVKTGDANDTDNYLWVKSKAKALKENSMNGLLSQRFEEGIQSIQEGIQKKGGTKKLEKVYERLGRLKQKYPSVHKYYDISVIDNGKGITTSIKYAHKKGEDPGKKAGIYFLRTTLNIEDEKVFWSIYNTIREIEYTFRVLKTDLDLRPIFHKTDDASMAHINLGLLAYWIVSTVRYQLKQKGYNSQWREIVRTMNTQKCVTTTMENIDNEIISIRQCSEPNKKVKDIYKMMKYKPVPFYREKYVVLPAEIFKNDSS